MTTLLRCLAPAVASGRAPLYGLTGQKVALVPDATGTEQPEEILWKHNGNKVVEFDGKTQTAFGLFQSRVVLDWISAELMITDLRSDDSGEYDLEVYANQMLRKQTLNLMVLGKYLHIYVVTVLVLHVPP